MDTLRDVRVDCGVRDYPPLRLTLWDSGRRDWRGQTRIAYRLCDANGTALFEGDDFAGSPMHADDSDETVASLLTFLTLRRGDTDAEYFDHYTPEQVAWSESSACETLAAEIAMGEEHGGPWPWDEWTAR